MVREMGVVFGYKDIFEKIKERDERRRRGEKIVPMDIPEIWTRYYHHWYMMNKVRKIVKKGFDKKEEAGKGFKKKSFLEVGCGTGISCMIIDLLEKDHGVIVGVDYDEHAVELADELKKRWKLRDKDKIEFKRGDAFNLERSVDNEKFDVVYSVGLIEHYSWKEIAKLLEQMDKHLKTNGYLIVITPNYEGISNTIRGLVKRASSEEGAKYTNPKLVRVLMEKVFGERKYNFIGSASTSFGLFAPEEIRKALKEKRIRPDFFTHVFVEILLKSPRLEKSLFKKQQRANLPFLGKEGFLWITVFKKERELPPFLAHIS